jgi:integrase
VTIAKLIPETVATLTNPDLYWDETLKGFGLNVRRDARGNIQRSFVIQYRVGKQQRKLKLGDAAKLNAKQARKKAEELFAQITLGQDPQGERKAERTAPTLTLRTALEKYIEMKETEVREGTYRDNSLKITRLYLLGARYFGPLHKVGINAITRQAVAARLHEIRQASSDTSAGRARAQLTAAFTRLMQEGLAEMNPCLGTKGQTERAERDRVLSEDERRAVWNACDLNTDFGKIVRLLILTGCRREEIGGLMWREVNLDAGTISLPAARTKNGRAHTLTLPKMALDILASVPPMHNRDYLFGLRSRGFRSWQVQKARFKDGVTNPWKIHDLRRTVATGMADLGIQPHVIEAVLNHTSGHKAGVAGIYNRSTYAREMKNALAIWSDHIASIITGSERKVVNFPTFQQPA